MTPVMARRRLADDLGEILRFAGPHPDPVYMAKLLLALVSEGRYGYRAKLATRSPCGFEAK